MVTIVGKPGLCAGSRAPFQVRPMARSPGDDSPGGTRYAEACPRGEGFLPAWPAALDEGTAGQRRSGLARVCATTGRPLRQHAQVGAGGDARPGGQRAPKGQAPPRACNTSAPASIDPSGPRSGTGRTRGRIGGGQISGVAGHAPFQKPGRQSATLTPPPTSMFCGLMSRCCQPLAAGGAVMAC